MKLDKKWNILSNVKVKSEKEKDDLVKILLENRGITSKKDTDQFLNPKLEDVTVASVEIDKKQLDKTIARIKKAFEAKETIVIFGDYDVDGITGTAILWESFYQLSKNVTPYIPHRVDEGYGLSIKGIENVKEQMPNVSLIITVDNGIVANEAVDFANSLGIDVIITDHHTTGEKLPNAYSIVHTTKLCGAGVAWMLSREISSELIVHGSQQKDITTTNNEPITNNYLDLVALATVADLVPLTGANRILLSSGLPYLQKTKRLGLQELFNEAGIESKDIGVYEIGHVIGPRLNAMGRLESAMDSLRLLCTKDLKRAKLLANHLGLTNRDRQLVTKARALHAIEQVKTTNVTLKNLLFIAHESYEEGVIGLVAGKLVEQFYRPSIVVAIGQKVSKASARSVSGFNIIEFIRSASHLLINAGGHPMAAGFTVETEKIALLQKALEKLADGKLTQENLTPTLKVDCELSLSLISEKLYSSLQKLSPFGMGNPEPTFVSRGVEMENLKIIGKDKTHLKLTLSNKHSSEQKSSSQNDLSSPTMNNEPTNHEQSLEAIAFSMAEKAQDIKPGSKIDVVYTLDENEWNGRKTLQLKIRDFKLS